MENESDVSSNGGEVKTFTWKSDEYVHYSDNHAKELSQLPPGFKIPDDEVSYQKQERKIKGKEKLDIKAKEDVKDRLLADVLAFHKDSDHIVSFTQAGYSEYPVPFLEDKQIPNLSYENDSNKVEENSLGAHSSVQNLFQSDENIDEASLDKVGLEQGQKIDFVVMGKDIRITADIPSTRPKVSQIFGNDDLSASETDPSSVSEKTRRIQVSLKSLEWQNAVGNQINTFGYVFLMDTSSGSRVSETHRFENSSFRVAQFDVSHPNPDIAMMIYIDKPYEGNVSDWIDQFNKGKVTSSKARSNYRQPMGWYVLFPFESNILGDLPQYISHDAWTDWFYRYEDGKWSDQELCALAASCKKGLKKFKQAPIKMQLKLQEISPSEKSTAEVCELDEITETKVETGQSLKHHIHLWPGSINLAKAGPKVKNVSIKVQIVNSDDFADDFRFLNVIHGTEPGERLDSWTTGINYHNRSPSFVDEIKADLPLPISDKCHILFTFYHVSYTNKRDDEIVAYSLQPLLVDGVLLKDQEVKLPMFRDIKDQYLDPAYDPGWMDSKKALFNCRIKISTSFYSQSTNLTTFYKQLSLAEGSEVKAAAALESIANVDNASLTKFWPIILNNIIEIITESSYPQIVQVKGFKTIVSILGKLHDNGLKRHPVAQSYTKNHFNHISKWKIRVSEQLPLLWTLAIAESDIYAKETSKYSWFFLELIAKDQALFHNSSGTLKSSMLKRGQKIPEKSLKNLQTLLNSLSLEVYRLSKVALNIGKDLNNEIAYFLLRSLSFLPPNFVLLNIWKHSEGFDNTIAIHHHVKLDFLRIICGYEHAIALSFPNAKLPETIVDAGEISSLHIFPCILQHFILSGLNSTKQEEIRIKCLQTLFAVLSKCENDDRFKDEATKAKIFSMYLPIVSHACSIAKKLIPGDQQDTSISLQEKRWMSSCLTLVLRYIDHALLIKWLHANINDPITSFTTVLKYTSTSFEYVGKLRIMQSSAKTSPGRGFSDNAKKYIENSYKAGNQAGNLRELRGTLRAAAANGKSTLKGTNRLSSMPEDSQQTEDRDFKIAGLQFHEISLVIFNITNSFFEISKTGKSRILFDSVFAILNDLLRLPQNQASVWIGLRMTGKLIVEFHKQILKSNFICSEICQLILQHSASCFKEIRALSAELIYLLLKYNHLEYKGSIGKIKTQLTVAISQSHIHSALNMKRSFTALAQFPNLDSACPKTLSQHVKNTVDALVGILRDQVRMKVHKDDPEMLADMMYNLYVGYANAPDLRIATLNSLAELHESQSYFNEAGFCKLHKAALISEFLKFKGVKFGGPDGSKAFKSCSGNLLDEKFNATDINPEEEGICQSPSFCENGLIEALNEAIEYFRKGQLFEVAIDVHKLLIPIYERTRNYDQLVQQYGNIKDLYENVISYTGRRILGTYFRVSYFGQKFGSLDGKEFIYKEKTVTQLSEIVFRLSEIYKNKYGEAFELVNDASKLAQVKENKAKAVLYITFVEPFLDEASLKDRQTYFERIHEINEFVFEKPYTKGGKAHGDIDTQYKKKTIVKVEKNFPYIKKRSLVVSTREIDLTPIEVSIEAIADRVEKLKIAVEGKPLTLKNIQLVLQGIVRPQVNQGPLAIATTFLDAGKAGNYKNEHVQALKLKFKDLSGWCAKGLQLSKEHSGEDQLEYNKDLEEGYNLFRSKLDPLIETANENRESKSLDSALKFLKDSKAAGSLLNQDELAAMDRFFK